MGTSPSGRCGPGPHSSSTEALRSDNPVVLYDGVCNLCNGAVRFIIARDREGVFRFAALQSEVGRALANECGLDRDKLDTVALVDEGSCFIRSDAAIRIASRLPGMWPALRVLRVVPRPLRDWGYDLVARNRYRLFGREDACQLPDQHIRDRFLDLGEGGSLVTDDDGPVG